MEQRKRLVTPKTQWKSEGTSAPALMHWWRARGRRRLGEGNKEAVTQGSPDSEAVPAEPVRLAWVRGGSAGHWSPYFRAVPPKAVDIVKLNGHCISDQAGSDHDRPVAACTSPSGSSEAHSQPCHWPHPSSAERGLVLSSYRFKGPTQ